MRDRSIVWYVLVNFKQLFSTLGERIKAKKICWIDSLTRRLPEQNDLYEDLAPKSDVANGATYIKALHWGIKNQRVKNIALAGPYGSGKKQYYSNIFKRTSKYQGISYIISHI